jgi:hypothetical protein
MAFDAVREVYVNPANVAQLNDQLFVQVTDTIGNSSADRSKPIYGPILVSWLAENAPDAFADAFGAPLPVDLQTATTLFAALSPAQRQQYLADAKYYSAPKTASGEAAATALLVDPNGVPTTIAAAAAAGVKATQINTGDLIGWSVQNAPAVLTSSFGLTNVSVQSAYNEFTTLAALTQRGLLLDRVYFNEVGAPARPDLPSSKKYLRGYEAVNTLFPAAAGYTDNLATYDLATRQKILANPFTGAALLDSAGKPITDAALAPTFTDPDTGAVVATVPLVATMVATGNLDMRLSTIETSRGGDITLLGPGGRVLAGSITRSSEQAARRGYETTGSLNLFRGERRNSLDSAAAIVSIPTGYEGVLTLRGGAIRGFTDGDLLLNQSRLFTLGGGDILLWSSNGDLNAGQGPKTTANFPPVVLRFDPNGYSEVNSAGAVSGAGISALLPSADAVPSDLTLIAPVGTVDAGDAGVRASGNVFVAAATVANSDNFKVGGAAFGVAGTSSVAVPASTNNDAAAAAASQAAAAATGNGAARNDKSRIGVEVLGSAASAIEPCPTEKVPAPCPVTPPTN